MRRPGLTAALCALALAGAGAVHAQVASVLGREGVVYRVVKGTCASLGECPKGAPGENDALALEWETPGQPTQRSLVPGTDNQATENHPSLAIDHSTDRVYAVWEARETIHSTLRLASYSAGEWSGVVEVVGNPWSFKRNPRLAVTHDSYARLAEDGETVTESRLVLHLVWWDVAAEGGRPLYSAVVVQDGAILSDFAPRPLAESLADPEGEANLAGSLYQTPQVRTVGVAGSRALVTFGDPVGGRIATLEIDVVGGDVVSFGDAARAQIIDIGRNGSTGSRQALADAARAQIIDIGRRLLAPEVAAFMTDRFLSLVADSDPKTDIAVVADGARAQIIDIGRRHREGMQIATGAARAQIIDIGRRASLTGSSTDDSAHVATFRVVRVTAAPWVPERTIRILTSEDGLEVALAWDTEGAVKYRQLEGGSWSDVRTLALGGKLDREQAYALIDKRLQHR